MKKITGINFKKIPSKVIVYIIGAIIAIIIGISLIMEGLSPTFDNVNAFSYPQSSGSSAIILSIQSDDMEDLNFSSLSNGVKPSGKQQIFILTNFDDKLEKFTEQNKRKEFLGLSSGAPKYTVQEAVFNAQPETVNNQTATIKGCPLYSGYSTIDDANKGLHKSGFLVEKDKIIKYKLGTILNTDQGKCTIQ